MDEEAYDTGGFLSYDGSEWSDKGWCECCWSALLFE